jgi:S-adenosylmethionine decarboxylase
MNTQTTTTGTPDYFFEGAEKRLEVVFRNTPSSAPKGLLKVSQEKWVNLLDKVNCQILNVTSNGYMTAFVLSESSLFVTSHRMLIKTCGNTTLLECLPLLMVYSAELNLAVEAVSYSHKNFLAPQRQLEGYRSFETELEILNKYFDGKPFILEPTQENNLADRWFIYQSFPKCQSKLTGSDQKIEIIMTELDKKVMHQFFKGDFSSNEVTISSGISDIMPGQKIDSYLFDPCGYSMNSINTTVPDLYSTIHITPEAAFSYVSYECNLKTSSYQNILDKVLSVFKPNKFMVVVYAEKDAQLKIENPFSSQIPGFKRDGYSQLLFQNSARTVSCSRFSVAH